MRDKDFEGVFQAFACVLIQNTVPLLSLGPRGTLDQTSATFAWPDWACKAFLDFHSRMQGLKKKRERQFEYREGWGNNDYE